MLFVVQPTVTLASRLLLRAAFTWNRKQGRDPRYMLVVGTGQLAQDFADRVETHAGLGLQIVGHLAAPQEPDPVVTRPILGSIDQIHDVFRDQVVDEVALCLPPVASRLMEPIASVASGEGKTVRIAVDPIEELLPGAVQEEFDGIIVRSLVNDGQREIGLVFKRLIDVVLSAVGLIIVSPILLVAALAIRLRDGAPVLFRQTRVGRDGRRFDMLKFRSMEPADEEDFADELIRELKSGGVEGRDRRTGVGRVLRMFSVDELPQLFNVLKGEMSLVGPRPERPAWVSEFERRVYRWDERTRVKGGITGWAQVHGLRGKTSLADRAEWDNYYIENF
jgi:exopolysaccharide biosynthesis polyprenyl glycosylphosphotransferase